jgi:hypothetical protein
VTSRHARVPHPVPISQRHRLMSFTANGIERHFSKRKRDVKAFLFVQTNRDVARMCFRDALGDFEQKDSQTAKLCK